MRVKPFRDPTAVALVASVFAGVAAPSKAHAQPAPPADESVLGQLPITGTQAEHVTSLAVLPSLSPDLADVLVRGVVRRDFELTGMFRMIPDSKAPPGLYDFDDPVDVKAWQRVGAEVIVKVAARKQQDDRVEVLGLAYFLNVGQDPVYEKRLVVGNDEVRVTAHRVTDALLGAVTGRNGGFASRMTFSGRWSKHMRVFKMDSDGHDLEPCTPEDLTSIAPTWGPGDLGPFSHLYYAQSRDFAPFTLVRHPNPVPLAIKGSVYSVSYSYDAQKIAVAISNAAGSSIYTGAADGSGLTKVSNTEIATHPVWSPSGKLGWVGGGVATSTPRRIYVDGKPVSPPGFTASAPAFCDTEDGIRVVYTVAVAGDRRDLVMTDERGQGIVRLTQNQGSNTYPACSPDGRLLAFFSTRKNEKGMYLMSLKRWTTQKLTGRYGESLRWASLPPVQPTPAP